MTDENVFSGSFDGIIGLAYPSMSEPGLTPFFDTIMREGVVDKNIFAFYMSMNPLDDDSELTFGSYDAERFTGSLKWHPVINKLFWSMSLEDIRIGNQSIGVCKTETCLVTPDSGTSLSTMPTWAFRQFKKSTYKPGKECAEGDDFLEEDLVFVING